MAIPQGGQYNLTIYQGANYSQVFSLREADGVTPINITGYTATAQIRTQAGGQLLASLTCVVNGTAGDITISATPSVTRTITNQGVWSLEITNGADVYVVLLGTVYVHPEITLP